MLETREAYVMPVREGWWRWGRWGCRNHAEDPFLIKAHGEAKVKVPVYSTFSSARIESAFLAGELIRQKFVADDRFKVEISNFCISEVIIFGRAGLSTRLFRNVP